MSDNGKNPLVLLFEWIGDQMYGVWLLFRPTSGSEENRPDGTQPGEASPPNPDVKTGE